MATIEERAKKYATIPAQIRGFGEDIPEEFDGEMYAEYIRIATEQDLIARQEERERCIKVVQDAWCKGCRAYCTRHGHTGSCIEYEEDCKEFNLIRKAIEEGGK